MNPFKGRLTASDNLYHVITKDGCHYTLHDKKRPTLVRTFAPRKVDCESFEAFYYRGAIRGRNFMENEIPINGDIMMARNGAEPHYQTAAAVTVRMPELTLLNYAKKTHYEQVQLQLI